MSKLHATDLFSLAMHTAQTKLYYKILKIQKPLRTVEICATTGYG